MPLATSPSSRRLLLVEIVTHERWVYNSRYFPFILGVAAEFGIDARWIGFGSRVHTEKTGPAAVSQTMPLGSEELAQLEAAVDDVRPTHVIISHPLTGSATRRIQRDGALVLSTSDQPAPPGVELVNRLPGVRAEPGPGGRPADGARVDWLLAWLGETPASCELFGEFLVGRFEPTYEVSVGNAAFRAYQPNVILMGGLVCDHFAPVRNNRHFAGVDLRGCAQEVGCSFCTHSRGPTSDLAGEPVAMAEAQLRRLVAAPPETTRWCGRIEVHDVRLLRRLDAFADMLAGVPLPPTTFLFEPRLDRFLEVADDLEAVLPKLAALGHRVSLLRMGAESLVEEENELYNKKITLAQIDEAAARLARMATDHPDSFDYDPTWGFITCSPWTTLEMLETTIERAIERGFEPLGVWLYTPLYLYNGSPLTRLARRQGDILADEFDDIALLYEAAANQVAFDSFLPWRFRDRRTAVAFSCIVRFCAAALRHKYQDSLFESDTLYAQLRTLDDELLARPDLFARRVIGLVRAEPEISREEALARALEAHRSQPESRDDPRYRLTFLLEAVRERLALDFEVRVIEVEPRTDGIRLGLELDGAPLRLQIYGRRARPACLFETRHFAVVHEKTTPVPARLRRDLVRLIETLDRAVSQYAPELLPS